MAAEVVAGIVDVTTVTAALLGEVFELEVQERQADEFEIAYWQPASIS